MAFGLKKIFSQLHTKTPAVPTQVVGIDLGSSSIKVVELVQKENVLTLKTYGELQLGPYADQELGKATRLAVGQQTEALVDVLRESKVTATSGVMTLQLSTSFVTVFGLNAKENEDISPRVRVEARKYIPVPMTDVTLDWSELPALGESSSSVREVLVAAVQNEARAETFKLLQAVKMSSQPTEIELFSALRAVSKTTDESIAIIDLGAQTSKLYIAHQGVVRKIHRVFVGGAQVTGRIAQQLQVPFEDAENQKRNYIQEGEHAAEIKKAMVTTIERPLQEFKRVLGQYELRSGAQVSRVVLTGGSASFIEMQAYVNYMFDRSVEKANPFTKVAYPAFMEDTLADIAPTFSVALGAALRPFEVTE
jgi:type IV pilus assembly protein PilM